MHCDAKVSTVQPGLRHVHVKNVGSAKPYAKWLLILVSASSKFCLQFLLFCGQKDNQPNTQLRDYMTDQVQTQECNHVQNQCESNPTYNSDPEATPFVARFNEALQESGKQ